MKKVLIASTVISFIEWFEQETIKLLQEQFGCQVHIACNCDYFEDTSEERTQEFMDRARASGVIFHNINFARSPFSIQNVSAYKQIRTLVDRESFDMIHCHTPLASILVRLASRGARRHGTKVVCTSHGFHFFKGAPKQNWLLYYPIEKICSMFTDVLITINQEDYALAKKRFNAKKTEYVPGVGIDVAAIISMPNYRQEIRKELSISPDDILVLGVGELNENKNHEIILRALAKLNNPKIHFVLAGNGPFGDYLTELSESLGIAERFHLLGFRRDVLKLYQAADIMVFPSFREGLPLSVMEGMSSGLPFVASNIRGITDLLQNKKGAFLFKPDAKEDFAKGIESLAGDSEMRRDFGEFNQRYVYNFSKERVMDATKKIYKTMLNVFAK